MAYRASPRPPNQNNASTPQRKPGDVPQGAPSRIVSQVKSATMPSQIAEKPQMKRALRLAKVIFLRS